MRVRQWYIPPGFSIKPGGERFREGLIKAPSFASSVLPGNVVLGLSAALLFGGGHAAFAATPSDVPEFAEMHREMMAMRTRMNEMRSQMGEMRNEITYLKGKASRKTVSGGVSIPAADQTVSAGAGTRVLASAPDPRVHFTDPSAYPRNPLGVPYVAGRPVPTREASVMHTPAAHGVALSEASFRAATENNEVVQIGGITVGFPAGRPTISANDGKFGFSAGLTFQEDFGGFMGMSPRAGETKGDFPNFTENARRLRLLFSWRYRNWVVNVTPDFGSSSVDGSATLYEANLNYAGFRNTVLTVGYFQPRITEENAEGSNAFEFLERPAITDLVRNLAGGIARFSIGGTHAEKRWIVSGYFTGHRYGDQGSSTAPVTDSQTGAVFRLAGRPYVSRDVDVHVGVGSMAAFKVNQLNGRTYSLSLTPEVALGESSLISAKITNVAQVWAAGPQFALRWKRFLVKGEYYHIGVQRGPATTPLPALGFDGWYIAANYTLLGSPRIYSVRNGAFTSPGIARDANLLENRWGALEISGRWSVVNLNDREDQKNGVRGGQQTVWSGGVNWYPDPHLKIMLDYNRMIATRNSQAWDLYGRTGNSVVGRVQVAF